MTRLQCICWQWSAAITDGVLSLIEAWRIRRAEERAMQSSPDYEPDLWDRLDRPTWWIALGAVAASAVLMLCGAARWQ